MIDAVFQVATYTYGPLLGLFAFGLFTRLGVRDKLVPLVCIIAPLICYMINFWFTSGWLGFATLPVNGATPIFVVVGDFDRKSGGSRFKAE
ncbi:MAG: hypothetical protein IPN95_19445 [Bacteroidetes bacterium]|nr:hypothetical protein [Bacteroidota bacterium]